MALLWGGYTLGFWGWTRLQGWDISLGEIIVPGRYKGASWPPALINDGGKQPDPMGGPSHNGVPKGSHPGDMPWTYPTPPTV